MSNCGCKASTGICGCITYGTGKLDDNGYWENLCPHGSEVHTCNAIKTSNINDRIPTTEVVSAIKILNRCYTLYKPWPGHDSHFHTTFISWLECPQTCVEEVQEFFSKI